MASLRALVGINLPGGARVEPGETFAEEDISNLARRTYLDQGILERVDPKHPQPREVTQEKVADAEPQVTKEDSHG